MSRESQIEYETNWHKFNSFEWFLFDMMTAVGYIDRLAHIDHMTKAWDAWFFFGVIKRSLLWFELIESKPSNRLIWMKLTENLG